VGCGGAGATIIGYLATCRALTSVGNDYHLFKIVILNHSCDFDFDLKLLPKY